MHSKQWKWVVILYVYTTWERLRISCTRIVYHIYTSTQRHVSTIHSNIVRCYHLNIYHAYYNVYDTTTKQKFGKGYVMNAYLLTYNSCCAYCVLAYWTVLYCSIRAANVRTGKNIKVFFSLNKCLVIFEFQVFCIKFRLNMDR